MAAAAQVPSLVGKLPHAMGVDKKEKKLVFSSFGPKPTITLLKTHPCAPGLVFCIHSASLCLLVGAFNPFTFSVIMDKYVFIAILLISLDCLFGSFFFFSSLLLLSSLDLLTIFSVVFGLLFLFYVCLL